MWKTKVTLVPERSYQMFGTYLAVILRITCLLLCISSNWVSVQLPESLHSAQVTGRELNHEYMGKPNAAPYELAEQLLYNQAVELGLIEHQQASAEQIQTYQSSERDPSSAFGAIYAVGDNPKADIAGALQAQGRGRPYVAMLVKTGVFSGDKANDEEFPADVVVEDVDAAVQAALHRMRSMRWHSMR